MSTRIALADDQALVREGLKLVLRGLGIDIAMEAADGRTLVDGLANNRVDVIVSDVRMPRLTGIEALRELRGRGDRTPMILLTTFDDSRLMGVRSVTTRCWITDRWRSRRRVRRCSRSWRCAHNITNRCALARAARMWYRVVAH